MLRKCLALTILSSAILLILFAGWGFDDWQEYFTSPARAGLIVAILSAAIISIFWLDLQPLRRGRLAVNHQTVVLLILAAASLGLIWFLPFADRRHILTIGGGWLLRYLGLLLCGGGIVIRWLALAKLGRQFSAYVTLQEDHQLIQTGIYRKIRHPLYLSLILAAPGMALVFQSLLVWPILMITVIFVAIRIRQEERLLKAEFGESFEQYRMRSWALLALII